MSELRYLRDVHAVVIACRRGSWRHRRPIDENLPQRSETSSKTQRLQRRTTGVQTLRASTPVAWWHLLSDRDRPPLLQMLSCIRGMRTSQPMALPQAARPAARRCSNQLLAHSHSQSRALAAAQPTNSPLRRAGIWLAP